MAPATTRAAWDMHTHLVPPGLMKAARRGRFGLGLGGERLTVGREAYPVTALADVARLQEHLQAHGFAGALVSVPPFLYRYDLSPREATSWAALVNDALAELALAAKGTLGVLGHVPLPYADRASEEMRRIDEGVFVGLSVGTSPGGTSLDDPDFEVFLEAANSGRWFVFIHPMDAPDARLADFYLGNLLGNPYETTLAAARLIFSDIPGRFGGITFALAHAAGAVPALVGRWERGLATSRPGVRTLSLSPREALGRFYADSVAHDDAALSLLVAAIGPDHVLSGSDWPFPMGDPDPVRTLTGLFHAAWPERTGDNLRRALGERSVYLDGVKERQ